ncbi:hypothetical protein BGX26_002790 [Mortierella sp. AD094]|nr:hypothetical protein BGX26_002790 [Mortierella sp. AD094]
MEKTQSGVKNAQKKLLSAYREARYEVTYSITNPADYKEARVVVSALMRHLGAMNLVVQNECLLMLGHPDRDNDDLHTDSEDSPCSSPGKSSGGSGSGTGTAEMYSGQSSGGEIGDEGTVKSDNRDYGAGVGSSARLELLKELQESTDQQQRQQRTHQRRGSAAESRRVRQLLMRVEGSTERILKARKVEKEKYEARLQETMLGRGLRTEPSSPRGGSSSISQIHESGSRRFRSNSTSIMLDNKLRVYANAHPSSRNSSSSLSSSSSSSSNQSGSTIEMRNQSTVKSCFQWHQSQIFGFKRPRSSRGSFDRRRFHGKGNITDTRNSAVVSDVDSSTGGDMSQEAYSGQSATTSMRERHIDKVAAAFKEKKEREQKRARKKIAREMKAEQIRKSKKEQQVAETRARPPKEVAFGDRKLFMSFLDIVQEPLQRLSDSCSRSMVSLERELVAGLNAEKDRQERTRRRKAQRDSIIRKANAKRAAGEDLTAKNDETSDSQEHDPISQRSESNGRPAGDTQIKSLWKRISSLGRSQSLPRDELDYAENLRSAREMKEKVKNTKSDLTEDAPHLENPPRGNCNTTSTFKSEKDDDDSGLPIGVSYVEYITHELEVFDRAEAASLQKFISQHPALDVGPREEIFLIFFFIFALREIARELLRLGNHVEELDAKQRKEMEAEGRQKRKRHLWWPKVANFWHWFGWVGYSQTRVSGGYDGMIMSTTNLLEKQGPRLAAEEKLRIEAKAQEQQQNNRLQEQKRRDQMQEAYRRQRSVTSMGVVHENNHPFDLESGLRRSSGSRLSTHNMRRPSTSSIPHGVDDNWRGNPVPTISILPLSREPASKRTPEERDMDSYKGLPYNNVNQLQVPGDAFASHYNERLADRGDNSMSPLRYTVVEILDQSGSDVDSILQESNLGMQGQSSATDGVGSVEASGRPYPASLHNRAQNSGTPIARDPGVTTPMARKRDSTTPLMQPASEDEMYEGDRSESGDSGGSSFSRHNVSNSEPGSVTGGFSRHPTYTTSGFTNQGYHEHPWNHQRQQLQRGQEPSQNSGPPPATKTMIVNVPKLKTWRMRIWEWLQTFKSDEVRYGFKMSAAMSFIGLWAWLDWDDQIFALDRGQWAMMTVMAVLWPTVGAMVKVIILRTGGTIIGVVWALLTYIACPNSPYVICAMMLPIMVFTDYHGLAEDTIYELSYKRGLAVTLGILICVVMNTFLWPVLARHELREEIALLVGRQGVLFAELVNKFLLEESDPNQQNMPMPQKQRNSRSMLRAVKGTTRCSDYSEKRGNHEYPDLRDSDQPTPSPQQPERQPHRQRQRWQKQQRQIEQIQRGNDSEQSAFQSIEQQLQTRLINIGQLLELSKSEPRLKEDFPVKLYTQIVKCCQNILDRMVYMRMSAQLLSPEVRDLVTGPMNFYRRDMVGALLMYFNVLSSSLASKSPLPPYLPSARMARLRVMFNVRKAIAVHQAETGEDHYTYIYYYAFSSALEEVIEELELLAILIKPIVGITAISSVDSCGYGCTVDQSNFLSAISPEQSLAFSMAHNRQYSPERSLTPDEFDRQYWPKSNGVPIDLEAGVRRVPGAEDFELPNSPQIQVQQQLLQQQINLQQQKAQATYPCLGLSQGGLLISTGLNSDSPV